VSWAGIHGRCHMTGDGSGIYGIRLLTRALEANAGRVRSRCIMVTDLATAHLLMTSPERINSVDFDDAHVYAIPMRTRFRASPCGKACWSKDPPGGANSARSPTTTTTNPFRGWRPRSSSALSAGPHRCGVAFRSTASSRWSVPCAPARSALAPGAAPPRSRSPTTPNRWPGTWRVWNPSATPSGRMGRFGWTPTASGTSTPPSPTSGCSTRRRAGWSTSSSLVAASRTWPRRAVGSRCASPQTTRSAAPRTPAGGGRGRYRGAQVHSAGWGAALVAGRRGRWSAVRGLLRTGNQRRTCRATRPCRGTARPGLRLRPGHPVPAGRRRRGRRRVVAPGRRLPSSPAHAHTRPRATRHYELTDPEQAAWWRDRLASVRAELNRTRNADPSVW
jgi:hypothetical protein